METAINSLKTFVLVFGLVLGGCQYKSPPDPNETPPGQEVSGELLLKNINETMHLLDDRLAKGEIDKQSHDSLLKREVAKMLKPVDVPNIPPSQAWQFGDAFRLADDWKTASTLYAAAVKIAKTDDRFVNDTLRLARAEAHLGDVAGAIKSCRSTFRVGPLDKAPILLAILYEVVPEATGKGKDLELAKLLEDAIGQHELTIVDAKSEAGKAFLVARPAHVHNAWIRIARFYQAAGKDAEARQAILKDEVSRLKRASI